MGAYGGLGDHIRVSVVSDSRPAGLEAKIWMLFLEFLGRGQMRTLRISLKRQFLHGKMELSTGSYMPTVHVIRLLQVTFFVQ